MIRCPKPRIAVFSGPRATIANTPVLVTSNKGRAAGEQLDGRFDHLVPQRLHEPVRVRIEKFSAHPLESDAADVYHDDGKSYYEVELRPEDGAYLLPYMARRADGSEDGTPFEAADLGDPGIGYGGRQSFLPDALPAVRGYRPRVGRAPATTVRRASWTASRSSTSCACSLRRAT